MYTATRAHAHCINRRALTTTSMYAHSADRIDLRPLTCTSLSFLPRLRPQPSTPIHAHRQGKNKDVREGPCSSLSLDSRHNVSHAPRKTTEAEIVPSHCVVCINLRPHACQILATCNSVQPRIQRIPQVFGAILHAHTRRSLKLQDRWRLLSSRRKHGQAQHSSSDQALRIAKNAASTTLNAPKRQNVGGQFSCIFDTACYR